MSMESRRRRYVRAAAAALAAGALVATALAPPAISDTDDAPRWDAPTGRLSPAAFTKPPATSRPHAFWFWNGKLTEQELVRQLEEMKGKGVEEFFIHPRQGLGGEFGKSENSYYLSRDYFDKVGFTIEQARKRGMKAWLYDDLNWPSGFAGGRTVRGGEVDGKQVPADPGYVPWYLAPIAKDVEGGTKYDEPVPVKAPEGPGKPAESLVSVVALPKARDGSCVTGGQARGVALDGSRQVDLTGKVSGGRLTWDVPEGNWCLLHLVQRPLLNYHPDLEPDEPYVDMLNPDVTKKFIDITHETYAARVGKDFGKTIQGIFNDEPGFYNNFPDGRGGADSRGSIPWTPGFAEYLERNAGRDLTKDLAAMWYDTGAATTRTRVAFHDALSDRYNEAHTVPLARWAREHRIALISNPLVEEDLGSHRLIQGGSWFEMQRDYQLPGMDLIGGLDTSVITPKLNSSVAHVFRRPRNLAETFGAFGWDLNMEEMKRTAAWEAAGGVDLMDNHAFYYSIDGKRATESPPSEFFQNPFWPRFRQYADLVGRLMEPARGSTPVNPVGVLYPSSSVMGTGTPWDVRGFAGNGTALGPVDASWKSTSNALLSKQLDFDYLDELALARDPDLGVDLKAAGGALRLGGQKWQALVLPRTTVLDLRAVAAMEKLVAQGGTVVAVDGLPTREARGHDDRLTARLKALFGTDPARPAETRTEHGRGLAAFLPSADRLDAVLRERVVPGVTLAPATGDVRVRHVRRAGDDAYLLVNLAGRKVDTTAVLDVAGIPEIWDPDTGRTRVAPVFTRGAKSTEVPLRLDPYQAVWVVFRPGAHTEERTPRLTATNATAESVLAGDGTLRARLTVERPGEVYATGAHRGERYGAVTRVDDPLTPLALDGDWEFTFDRPGADPVRRPLGSWTDLDPRWSGSGTYTRKVTVPAGFLAAQRRITLDLGDVRELAAVSVNGAKVGDRDWAPYALDVTDRLREGENTISVTVTNTGANGIAGSPIASGLLGPVSLRPTRVVDLNLTRDTPVTAYNLDVQPASAGVSPGGEVTLSATVSGIAPGRLSGAVQASVPAGWTAEPARAPVSADSSGREVSVTVPIRVAAPAGAAEGDYPVRLAFQTDDGEVRNAEAKVLVRKPFASWEFATDGDTEGWTAGNQVTPLTVSGGALRFSSTGGDPYVVGPQMSVPLPGGGAAVEVEMTASTSGAGQLFWATSEGGFAESRSGRFEVSAGTHRYRIPIPGGQGELRQLRLDPATGPGDFAVNLIRVLP